MTEHLVEAPADLAVHGEDGGPGGPLEHLIVSAVDLLDDLVFDLVFPLDPEPVEQEDEPTHVALPGEGLDQLAHVLVIRVHERLAGGDDIEDQVGGQVALFWKRAHPWGMVVLNSRSLPALRT